MDSQVHCKFFCEVKMRLKKPPQTEREQDNIIRKLISQFQGYVCLMIQCKVPRICTWITVRCKNDWLLPEKCQVSVSVPISGSKYQNSPIWFTVISSFIKFLLGYFRFLVKKSPFKYPSKVIVSGVDRTIAEIVPVYSIYDRNSHYCSKKSQITN